MTVWPFGAFGQDKQSAFVAGKGVENEAGFTPGITVKNVCRFVNHAFGFGRSFIHNRNFLAVALALHDCNYRAVGLRLDSGDLAYLSLEVRKRFTEVSEKFNLQYMENFTIMASNDINEDILISLEIF